MRYGSSDLADNPRSKELVGKLKVLIEGGLISQSGLAKELGVHRQRVNRWIKLGKTPSLEEGLVILDYLERISSSTARSKSK